MSETTRTRALYNGDCPICDGEMCRYAAYTKAEALPMVFEDLNAGDQLSRWGVSEDEATRLLHVIHDDKLHIGFDAMVVLWEQMPRYQSLARISRTPGLFQVLSWGYTHVVARYIYMRHQRRKARGQIGQSR